MVCQESFTELQYIIEQNNATAIKQLLESGIDLNARDEKRRSLLHIAAGNDTDDMINILLANNFDVNVADLDGETPLITACKKNKLNNVNALIKHGANVSHSLETTGDSALHFAVKFAGKEITECLINRNISVNVVNNDNQTPLMWACSVKNNIRNVTTLLEHGADVNVANKEDGASALHFAAKYADQEIIESLLKANASINITDDQQQTPLMWACTMKNNSRNVAALICHGADVNVTKQWSGLTALHLAAEHADRDTIKCLLDQHISVNVIDNNSWTPLMKSVTTGNVDNVTTLLELGADINMTTDRDVGGFSVLHFAAVNGDKDIIECLLNHNISVNMVNKDDETPLMMACSKQNNIDNVITLLDHKADVNMIKDSGRSALHFAAKYADSKVVKCLLDHNISVNVSDRFGETPIQLACEEENSKDKVALLLAYGAETNLTDGADEYRASVLHYAAKHSDSETVKCLLDHNVSVNVVDNCDETPLLWACKEKNKKDVISTLLAFGADVNKTTKWGGFSALHLAAENADSDTIKYLLDHNISVNVTDNAGNTPLQQAIWSKNNENVAMLLALGANINVLNKEDGASMLHLAAKYGNSKMIEIFLDNNISVNVLDAEGRTPLLWACESDVVENVATLIARGADINATSKKDNASALHYATKRACDEVVTCLLENNIALNVADSNGWTPLMWACSHEYNVGIVEAILAHGADTNIYDKEDCFALHIAARFANSGTLNCLFSYNVSANIMTEANLTALMWACQKKYNITNVTTLLEHGADINVKLKKGGMSALHFAAIHGDNEVVSCLLSHNICVNVTDEDHRTPLIAACSIKDNGAVVEQLLSAGADINMVDKEGASALHIAAKYASCDIIQSLLNLNSSVNMTDQEGKTPLMYACTSSNNLDNITLLVSNRANLNSTTSDGRNCLHFAKQNSDEDAIKYLIELGA